MALDCQSKVYSSGSAQSRISFCVEGYEAYTESGTGNDKHDYTISIRNEAVSGGGVSMNPVVMVFRNGSESRRRCFDLLPGESTVSILDNSLVPGDLNQMEVVLGHEQPGCSGELVELDEEISFAYQADPEFKGIVGDVNPSTPTEGGSLLLVVVVLAVIAFIVLREGR